MQNIQLLFADYASYHQTKGNKWFHRFGIPMIMLTLIGMLVRVKLGPVDAASGSATTTTRTRPISTCSAKDHSSR